MVTIKLEIKNCSDCPNCKQEREYTGDSFEHVEKWHCKAANRLIGFAETFDKPEVPSWCPIREQGQTERERLLAFDNNNRKRLRMMSCEDSNVVIIGARDGSGFYVPAIRVRFNEFGTIDDVVFANTLRDLFFRLIAMCLDFPYPQVCRHLVGGWLVEALDELYGPDGLNDLAAAIVRAEDDTARAALTALGYKERK